jgi:pimeloyl-ACP methyl ester carboxylesterase
MGYKFVLVHGSWQDARSWDAVTPLLERMGHQVWAPTIAGHAPSTAKNVSHAECVASIVDAIRHHGVSDFVLVGHSFGGTIIQRVAEEMPERIRRLVFWNAFVLNDGDNLDSNTPPHYRALFEQIAQPDGSAMLPFPIWREVSSSQNWRQSLILETANVLIERSKSYPCSVESTPMGLGYE